MSKFNILVGENYEKDAIYINDLVRELSSTSEELLASIKIVQNQLIEYQNQVMMGQKVQMILLINCHK